VDEWAGLLDRQSGLFTRRQALVHGMTRVELARAVRRRELVRVHPRFYVGHNGPLCWLERAWAAVLWARPAGLCGTSALRAFDQRDVNLRDEEPIHVVVARGRHLVAPPGVVLHRSAHVEQRVQPNLCPPRVRYEHTVLDLAESASDKLHAIAVLADACGSRRTTAARLAATLRDRPWARRRSWLAAVLDDVARGTCSVLEHGYLTRVERAHGLPTGNRQSSTVIEGRSMWRASGTASGVSSSNSTGGWATPRRATATVTSTATSTSPYFSSSPLSGSATGRSSATVAAPLPRSVRS
jgi:hypothetical protein